MAWVGLQSVEQAAPCAHDVIRILSMIGLEGAFVLFTSHLKNFAIKVVAISSPSSLCNYILSCTRSPRVVHLCSCEQAHSRLQRDQL